MCRSLQTGGGASIRAFLDPRAVSGVSFEDMGRIASNNQGSLAGSGRKNAVSGLFSPKKMLKITHTQTHTHHHTPPVKPWYEFEPQVMRWYFADWQAHAGWGGDAAGSGLVALAAGVRFGGNGHRTRTRRRRTFSLQKTASAGGGPAGFPRTPQVDLEGPEAITLVHLAWMLGLYNLFPTNGFSVKPLKVKLVAGREQPSF